MHAHFVVYIHLGLIVGLVCDRDIQVARVACVRRARQPACDWLVLERRDRVGRVKYSLPARKLLSAGERRCPRISAYFQCVYLACGPVENFTFVCVHSNEMSNHARKAWTSAGSTSD